MKLFALLSALLYSICAPALADSVAPPAAPAAARLSSDQQQAEISGAQAALKRLEAVKKFADVGPCLSNHSAGLVAILVGGLNAAVEPTTADLDKNAEQSVHQPSPFAQRFNAVIANYGTTGTNAPSDAVLQQRGRELFADIVQLMKSLPDSGGINRTTEGIGRKPGDLTYRVISATQVQATSKSSPKDNFTAVLEDGQWRIDLGDLSSMLGVADGRKWKAVTNDSSLSNQQPKSPIFDAILFGDVKRVKAMYSADPSVIKAENLYHATPLMQAVFFRQPEIVSFLLHKGAQVNLQDDTGYTALMKAARVNDLASARQLLAHGAKTKYHTLAGTTALSVAKQAGFTQMVKLLEAAGATR